MFYPNSDCAAYCDWLLNVSDYRWSGPRLSIINTVNSAAIAATSVTDNIWRNFNMITAPLYGRYLQYVDLAAFGSNNLNVNLIGSYSFEGNAVCSNGAFSGTLIGCTFSNTYGKITQGILPGGGANYINIPNLNVGSYFSFVGWVKIPAFAAGNWCVFAAGANDNGLYINGSNGQLMYYDGGYINTGIYVPINSWSLIGFIIDTGVLKIILNTTITNTGLSVTTGVNFTNITGDGYGRSSNCYYDIFSMYSRVLDVSDLVSYYAGGNGIQYPF